MNALTLLFVLIFGMLCLLAWQLRKFISLRSSMRTSAKLRHTKTMNQAKVSTVNKNLFEMEKELEAVINIRLQELDQQFPESPGEQEPGRKLTSDFKNMLHSALIQLKSEHSIDCKR